MTTLNRIPIAAKLSEQERKTAVVTMLRSAATIAGDANDTRDNIYPSRRAIQHALLPALNLVAEDTGEFAALDILLAAALLINSHEMYSVFGGLQVLCTALAAHVEGHQT